MRLEVPLATEAYKSGSLPIAAQSCLNLHITPAPEGARNRYNVRRNAGIKPWAEAGGGPCRGGWVWNEQAYVVSGNSLYRIDSAGTPTTIGTIPGSTSERVTMRDNGPELAILTGVSNTYKLYTYDGTTLAEVTDVDFLGGTFLEFFDLRMICGRPGSGEYAWSDLNDATAWNGLGFATAEGLSDDLLAGIRTDDQLVLFGSKSIELLYSTGDADLPYARSGGGLIQVGIVAPESAAFLDGAAYFVAIEDGGLSVRALRGNNPAKVSSEALDEAMLQYGDVSDAWGFTYTHRGHAYYVLTFPGAPATWCLDIGMQRWHTRSSWNLGRWRVGRVLTAYGKVLALDTESGQIGELDFKTFGEWGEILEWEVTSAQVSLQRSEFVVDRLELDIETGTATATDEEPQVMMSWSDDWGRTWSNEHWAGLGLMGEYQKRVKWHRLGKTRGRIFKFRGTDAVIATLMQCWGDGDRTSET